MPKKMQFTDIKDQVFVKLRNAQYKYMKKDRGVHFHATDYTNECVRNIFYSKMIPKEGMDTSLLTTFWVGSAIHDACQIAIEKENHEYSMVYNIETDKAIIDMEDPFDPEKPFDYLKGTLDDLVEIEVAGKKEWCIVDKKTWRSRGWKKTSPSDNHVIQVNIYRVMLKASRGIDAKYGAIVYFDMWQDGVEKPQVMPFELDPVEKTRAKLLDIKKQLESAQKTGKLPQRTIHWRCNGYCPFAERCFQEEEVKKGAIEQFVVNV